MRGLCVAPLFWLKKVKNPLPFLLAEARAWDWAQSWSGPLSIRGRHAGVEASLSLVESPNLAWPFTCKRNELSDTLSPGSVALKPAQSLFPGVLNAFWGFSQSELGLY